MIVLIGNKMFPKYGIKMILNLIIKCKNFYKRVRYKIIDIIDVM